jgi:uncharacterized protein (TIGR03083 family)
MTIFGPIVDTRALFADERAELLGVLGSLSPPDWSRPTVCPGWDVHDVVGHVLNNYLRRLSGSRDGFGGAVFTDDETLPSYLARTNEEFVRATRQCSPEVMIEMLAYLGPQLDQMWAETDLTGPADLNVSWAGPRLSGHLRRGAAVRSQSCCRQSDGLHGSWLRDRLATLAEYLDVERDRLAHLSETLIDGVSEGHAAREIGRPGAIAAVLSLLYDHRVARSRSSPQSSLLQDAALGAQRQVLAELAGDHRQPVKRSR